MLEGSRDKGPAVARLHDHYSLDDIRQEIERLRATGRNNHVLICEGQIGWNIHDDSGYLEGTFSLAMLQQLVRWVEGAHT